MPYPDTLLARGERVVMRKHPSAKVLVLPVLFLLLIIGGASALIAWSRSWKDSGATAHTPWLIGIIVVGLILLIWLVIAPFVRWRTEHFVLSTGHVFFRTGILKRREHQIPLGRIQNLEIQVTFWGRLLGYGSLIVESAADQPLEFENVASLPKVQSTLNQLIADDRAGLNQTHGPDAYLDERASPGYRSPQAQAQAGPATQAYPTEQMPPAATRGYPPPPAGYPTTPPQGQPPTDPGR